MTEFHLAEQMYSFVKTAQMVKKSQIRMYFRKYEKGEVEYILSRLIHEGYLHEHGEERISSAKHLHVPISEYDSVIDAVEILCRIPEDEVLWLSKEDYPFDLCFGTVSGSVYCITSYTTNWRIKYALTPAARKKYAPSADADTVKYIAVVRDMDVMVSISELDFYNYHMINPDGTIDRYEPPEK